MYKQVFLLMIVAGSISARSLRFEGQAEEHYISKWGFYEACDFGYDPLTHPKQYPFSLDEPTTFNPKDVLPGSRISIRGRSVPEFFQTIAPEITVPYSIVTHGEYLDAFSEDYLCYLNDPMVIAWFGTHPCPIKHSKFHPIPLGVHPRQARKSFSFSRLRNKKKKRLVYANFEVRTHPERSILLKRMKRKSFCYCSERCSYSEFLSQMASCKFTLSPRGLGIDCYRTWEALLVGSIPIIKSSYLDSFYDGLPVLIVEDWDCITEEFLEAQYRKITAKTYRLDKLYLSYWLSLMDDVTKAADREIEQ